ncbi:hypothetical protein KIW84_044522 [Lathyrus oleraceus]|uniref:RRM domain-containing protein n=1 Tax=Pisum sativum TaxID=3888 RepID=A0A9D5AVY8_PEA|nr:hypothetical protein KIW84_044522 [Pisum sativum]
MSSKKKHKRNTATAMKTTTFSTTATALRGTGEPLAPSKSTLYVSNLDYSLTNSDLHTLFSTFGRIARVTVLKDRHTRLSRGVAFVQFVSRNDAQRAVAEMNKKILNGRTLTASIAADNGRAPEFIRKRLGPRPRPQPKKPRRGFSGLRDRDGEEEGDEEEEEGGQIAAEQFDDNWASVVDDEAGERLLGRNKMMMRVWTTTRRRRKGRKLDIAGFDVVVEILKSIGCRLVVTITVAVLVESSLKPWVTVLLITFTL